MTTTGAARTDGTARRAESSGSLSPGQESSVAAMLMAQLAIRAPAARSFLVAAARSDGSAAAIAAELAACAAGSGRSVRFVDVGGGIAPANAALPDDVERIDMGGGMLNLAAAHIVLSTGADVIVASGGGLLDMPATLLAAAVVDAVVLVARQGRTARADLHRARREVDTAGGHILGAVLVV